MPDFPAEVQAAIDAGYAVVPASRDKKPYIAWKQWQTDEQTDQDRELLGAGSLWAVVTGEHVNTVVLDFDGEEGLATMNDMGLEAAVITPSGAHVYVHHPGWPVRNAVKLEGYPGMDIRGDGGLAYFSGRSSKGEYQAVQWPPVPQYVDAEEVFPEPEPEATPVAHGSHTPNLRATRYLERQTQRIRDAESGTSNQVTNKVAFTIGGLVGSGQLSVDTAYDAMLAAARDRQVGQPEKVISASFESGQKRPWAISEPEPADDEFIDSYVFKARKKRLGVPSVVPFPTSAFPAPLDTFIREGATALSVPEAYLGTAILPVLGTAIGGYVELEVRKTWKEGANLWTALVGPPGTAKSPAMSLAMFPILDAESAYRRAVHLDAAESDDPTYEVDPTRLRVDDATLESLQRVHSKNPRGIIMQPDELKGWIAGLGQYKRGGGRDRQTWLSIWSRQPLTVDRQTTTDVYIEKPFVSILGSVQPEVLEGLIHNSDDGLLPRLLFTVAEPHARTLLTEDISDSALAAYSDLWNDLRDQCDQKATIQLSSGAYDMFVTWYNGIANEAMKMDDILRGVWTKLGAQCARLALIVSQVNREKEVSVDSMERAISLTRYYQGQANEVLKSASSGTPYEKKHASRVDHISGLIEANPGIGIAGLTAVAPDWFKDQNTSKKVLRTLEDMGLWSA